ncbi:single-stranded DNA-binding protein [Bacteroidia bacterium]|nr:single-stranded DNA-binding protein [Bacteroidia bacterium]
MNSLNNSVRLLGNVGMDPEVITFDSGKKLAKFSLATNERKKNPEGGYQNVTTWHNLIIWGKGADIIQTYIKKGAKLAVEGKLTYNKYEDKQGNQRTSTEILVNDFSMLGGRNETEVIETAKTKKKADLPF